ncbi:MAG TPA: hypothetical protein VG165_10625 [Solirubrobacteraceae bacterium]|jgi:hypothetical protein|nr:hypothetical protein [Solirubrobacteraceae bacterium]
MRTPHSPSRDPTDRRRRWGTGRLPTAALAALAALAAGFPAAVVLGAPACAGASQWSATRTATGAGSSSQPVASVGGGDRLAIGWIRRLGGLNRAELREGTPAGGLRGPALVLDAQTHLVDSPALAFLDHRGTLAVAWRRYLDGNHRIRGAIVSPAGRAGPVATLSGAGESAYSPTFIHSPASFETVALGWSRRTFSQLANVTTAGFASPLMLPGAPIFGAVAAFDGAGTEVAAPSNGQQILDTERPAGAASFSQPTVIASKPTDAGAGPAIASTPNGSVVAVWAQGTALMAAVRPQGGVFAAPVQIAPAGREPRFVVVTADSANEILVAYLLPSANLPSGSLEVLRLGPTGRPLAPAITLAATSVSSPPSVATDNSGAFVGWSSGTAVHVIRIAPGGILGPVRTLPGPIEFDSLSLTGMPSFGAVATWVSHDRIVYSVYR